MGYWSKQWGDVGGWKAPKGRKEKVLKKPKNLTEEEFQKIMSDFNKKYNFEEIK